MLYQLFEENDLKFRMIVLSRIPTVVTQVPDVLSELFTQVSGSFILFS